MGFATSSTIDWRFAGMGQLAQHRVRLKKGWYGRYGLPLLGIFVSICLFVVSAAYYPGGTSDSTITVG